VVFALSVELKAVLLQVGSSPSMIGLYLRRVYSTERAFPPAITPRRIMLTFRTIVVTLILKLL
jgi:hypothetical protein